jgi:chemotaxis response regulator CheB
VTERAVGLPDLLSAGLYRSRSDSRIVRHVAEESPVRVLLGNLEPIMVVGLRQVLEDEGMEVIGAEREPEQLICEAERQQPDVVVLDRDEAARALGEQVCHAAPHAKVILWARDETVMEVHEAVSHTSRLVALTATDGLRDELSSGRHRQRVEE